MVAAPSRSEGRVLTVSQGALSDIRVLDLTTTFLGPYCTLMLADLGATVIKVEAPDGDISRHLGSHRNAGMGSVFLAANRGKRSVKLDLKTPHGQLALRRLIETSDVVVHNMRLDTAEKLGISYERVQSISDRIVYCQAYGFGRGGPYEGRPAYDDIIQGLCGLAAIQSHAKDEPEYIATALADKMSGLLAALGIVSALRWREVSGQGQCVEVPMFESMVAFTLLEQLGGKTYVPEHGPPLYSRMVAKNRRPYATKDGYICAVIYTEQHWHRFLRHIGREEILLQPRFATSAERSENIDELYGVLVDVLEQRTTGEWLAKFEELDIPAARLNTISDLFSDAHLSARETFKTVDHPSEGRIRVLMPGLEMSKSPVGASGHAPALGEHTGEILAELGLTDAEIASVQGEQGIPVGPALSTGFVGKREGVSDRERGDIL